MRADPPIPPAAGPAVRQAALKHDMYATFMAKPHENEPGSSMHIHQSVLDSKTGKNVFSDKDGNPSETLIKAKQERLDNWRTLQELAGII